MPEVLGMLLDSSGGLSMVELRVIFKEDQGLRLRVTTAMAAGVTNRVWEVSDLVALVEASEGLARAA